MKRFLAVILSAVMLVGILGGCGTETKKTEEEEQTTAQTETTESVLPENAKKVKINTPKKVDQMSEPEEGETVAILHIKDYGDISMKFFYEDSPLAVENFLTLAANGYYDGVIFHRVIKNFMVQGGDPDGTGMGGTSIWGKPFKNEYSTHLAHVNGSVAMARTMDFDTNESQFFINDNHEEIPEDMFTQSGMDESFVEKYKEYGGNPFLQDQYTVFAQVYDGMDVVDAISETETDASDKPVEDIVIESVEVTEYHK